MTPQRDIFDQVADQAMDDLGWEGDRAAVHALARAIAERLTPPIADRARRDWAATVLELRRRLTAAEGLDGAVAAERRRREGVWP